MAWLTRGDEPVLGPRHLAILEALRELGSLNAAAKHLHISYRDAWGKVHQAEATLGIKLIAARVGGAGGGGSRLSAAGEQLVTRLRAFHEAHRQAAARSAALYFGNAPVGRHRNGDRLVVATTTSAIDTGLLPALVEPFAKRMGLTVELRPVGSGAALRLARTGAADVVLTHAPDAEQRSLVAGDTVNRRDVMASAFVIVGPADDPAGVCGTRDVSAALRRIAAASVPFLSRADGSGTHQRERAMLAAAAVTPAAWYRRERAGMAELLRRADAIGAYALTDRGTFAALTDSVSLQVLHSADPRLANVYAVLATNPHQHAGSNYLAAMALIGWLTSPAAQELIAAYRVGGRRVAHPAAAGRTPRRPVKR